MTKARLEKFRRILEAMDRRVSGDIQSLEEQARTGLGGEAGGSLSNAPLHLADLGTEQYLQELNATLFENEEAIRMEIRDALGRLDRGAYGTCERCGTAILQERLEVLPYTRDCTSCSAEVGDGAPADLNAGRPEAGFGGLDRRHGPAGASTAGGDDLEHPFTDLEAERVREADRHAAGTAGGGTAIGGLAGTNLGEGDPDEAGLEEAAGSGSFDQELEEDDDETTTYSGPSGGAVGGAIANRRATGGKTGGGIAPRPDPGDSPVGS